MDKLLEKRIGMSYDIESINSYFMLFFCIFIKKACCFSLFYLMNDINIGKYRKTAFLFLITGEYLWII